MSPYLKALSIALSSTGPSDPYRLHQHIAKSDPQTSSGGKCSQGVPRNIRTLFATVLARCSPAFDRIRYRRGG